MEVFPLIYISTQVVRVHQPSANHSSLKHTFPHSYITLTSLLQPSYNTLTSFLQHSYSTFTASLRALLQHPYSILTALLQHCCSRQKVQCQSNASATLSSCHSKGISHGLSPTTNMQCIFCNAADLCCYFG